MERIRNILVCALLAVIIGAVVQITICVQTVTVTARALPDEIRAARGDLIHQVEAVAKDVTNRADRQITDFRKETLAEVEEIRQTADRRIGDTLTRVDAALGTVDQLHVSLQPAIDNTVAITANARDASAVLFRRDALPAQLLGLTGAAKVTLGQTATTMREIQRATPQMLSTVQDIGDNVRATTEASTEASRNTAQVMANFARATKPLPVWARIGLSVAPPLAQVGASVATTLAVTGKVGN